MRAFVLLIALGALVTPGEARSLDVIGNAGHLGEWELTATVTATLSGASDEFSGPLTMTHVGMCTQDGPERKTGEMRLQMSGSSSRLAAVLVVEGVECTYTGTLSGSYSGMLNCPDRRAIPLTLWLK